MQAMLKPVYSINESNAKQLWTRPEVTPMDASVTSGSGKALTSTETFTENGVEGGVS
jgi:hypothetical protein